MLNTDFSQEKIISKGYLLINNLFKLFFCFLEYSWSTMLWRFQVHSRATQPYIYMYPFSPKLPFHVGCHIHWAEFISYRAGPCWFSILNIAVCTRPPQTLYPLFSMSVGLFLVCRYVHLYNFFSDSDIRDNMQYFSLSDLLYSIWQSLGPPMLLQMELFHYFVVVKSLNHIWLWLHGLQHARLPCPPLSPGIC